MVDHTGPIGGGKLTGTGGGRLTAHSGTGRLREQSKPRGSEKKPRANHAPTEAKGTRPPERPRRPGPTPLTLLVGVWLILLMLVGAFAALISWLEQPNDGSVGGVVTDDFGTIFTESDFTDSDFIDTDGIFSDGIITNDDPASCFTSVDGSWTGVWASNRGAANGEVEVELRSSGTTVEGQVTLHGAPILSGGSLSGEIDCRTITLRIIDPTSNGYTISFTGTIGVDESSMRGPYSVTTTADGQQSVLDEGMFVVGRS